MRFSITAAPKNKNARLPVQYNSYLQSYLYSIFERKLPMVHELGFKNENHTFRHFTFSRIFSEGMKREKDYFILKNPIEFYASFLVDPMPEIVIDHLISDHSLRLANEEYEIVGATVQGDPIEFDTDEEYEMDIVAISPIVIHKTYYENEKKKTQYLKPYDSEFSKLIEDNLKSKLKTISDVDPDSYKFHISPTQFSLPRNEAVVKYKNFIIKGYTGIFHISGSSRLIRIAYHTGLGTKNAQGFGMFKIENIQRKEK